MQNKIVINADDFGLTESCSKAIAAAFEKKLISSTTAMANGKYIKEAYAIAEENGFLDKVGIHIVLTEGAPLTGGIKNDPFFCENGVFHGKINRLKKPNKEQIIHLKEEVSAQIKKLRSLGFPLTHADSHHHIHTDIFFIKEIEEVLKENGIDKIRLHRNFGKIKFYKKIVKDIFNKSLKKSGFISTEKMGSAEDLYYSPETADKFLCEIMVHPDFFGSGVLIDRKTWDGDVPTGEPLDSLKKVIGGKRLISYGEL